MTHRIPYSVLGLKLLLSVLLVTGQCGRLQRLQPEVPPAQQTPLLDLPGIADHAPFTRERHLDPPEGANHGFRQTGENRSYKTFINSELLFWLNCIITIIDHSPSK